MSNEQRLLDIFMMDEHWKTHLRAYALNLLNPFVTSDLQKRFDDSLIEEIKYRLALSASQDVTDPEIIDEEMATYYEEHA